MSIIAEIRKQTRSDDHVVTETLLGQLPALIDLPESSLKTPEYGHSEYLANCDRVGRAISATDHLANSISNLPDTSPSWLKVEDGCVMTLRWLAHFIGLRHHAVHLFLDPADKPDYTYVSIRSLSKYNQPGHLDMPVAGHVDGRDTALETLQKELREELGLDLDTDLENVSQLGHYNVAMPDFQPNYDEVEFTTLYRGTVVTGALDRVRLQEGEVGGLVLFRKDELNRWIREHSKQIGGGLVDSWARYFDGVTASGTPSAGSELLP